MLSSPRYTIGVYSTHAVVVITYQRPGPLAACLDNLLGQSRTIDEIVVVDQSPDDLSRNVCAAHETVRWVDNRVNAGNMTSSRNVGLNVCASDIVSFIDDDSLPTPDWAAEVMAAFARHPDAGGIAGRTSERGAGPPPPSTQVGLISPDGRVHGNFATYPTCDVLVDHALGTNMSFVRETLVALGGLREDYPGTAMGEDTDISVRVRKAGRHLYFAPAAHIVHDSAPHVVGQRFDLRYEFYAHSNYMLLFLRNFGWKASEVRGCALAPLRPQDKNRRICRSPCTPSHLRSRRRLRSLAPCLSRSRTNGPRRPQLTTTAARVCGGPRKPFGRASCAAA